MERLITREPGHLSYPSSAIVSVFAKQVHLSEQGEEFWEAEVRVYVCVACSLHVHVQGMCVACVWHVAMLHCCVVVNVDFACADSGEERTDQVRCHQ